MNFYHIPRDFQDFGLRTRWLRIYISIMSHKKLVTSGKYFNKGVKALDTPDIGHVVRETPDKIIVFGGGDERYGIPMSEIQQVGANVLIGLRMYDIITKYKVSRQELLPTSRPYSAYPGFSKSMGHLSLICKGNPSTRAKSLIISGSVLIFNCVFSC
ncbi:hypothetical protein BH18THE2_BH18THE2_24430 [soil metagenome]